MIYPYISIEEELQDLAERAEKDGEQLIAKTLLALLGSLNSPPHMQQSFAEYLDDYNRSAIIELQMIQNNQSKGETSDI